jgi:hypothetical protein
MGSQDEHRRPTLNEAIAARLKAVRQATEQRKQAAQSTEQEGSDDAA